MRTGGVTLQRFIESYRQRLGLQWLTGHHGGESLLAPLAGDDGDVSLVGHLNFIHPHRIQLLGRSELRYLAELGKNSLHDALTQLFDGASQLVIIADGEQPPAELLATARQSAIPLCTSTLS
ncbi:MAG: HPr(Ser) kinase/phosphatase, partial [Gammaproteobacteria bacterium]|nr:HPr(Ser) kinase/phosphatase [Gammaproteobacteria bacterium]